jgi:hypothetical protein
MDTRSSGRLGVAHAKWESSFEAWAEFFVLFSSFEPDPKHEIVATLPAAGTLLIRTGREVSDHLRVAPALQLFPRPWIVGAILDA